MKGKNIAKPTDDFGRFESSCILEKVSPHTALKVWHVAYRFQSWEIESYVADAPSKQTITKARKAVELFLT